MIARRSPLRDPEVVEAYRTARGEGRVYGEVTVCWAETEQEARRKARDWWPNAALPGELGQELPLPRHFEQAAQLVTGETVACGPDPRSTGLAV
ncbi:MAG TPA: hypothetical protein VNO34_07325 [Actinomycetota bacterium]|nr:hypothetical protein [Actinomycetota bacterium]